MECDRLATETAQVAATAETTGTQHPPNTILSPPYIGSRAFLRIRGHWITSHQKQHILQAQPAVKKMQTSKIMHSWLPTKHMEAHKTGNSHCPGCKCTDEKLDHMFRCPNKTITNKRDKLLIALRERSLNIGFPRPVMEALSKLL